ncbi:MAG: immunoglobulin domain-containing protein [Planctomycetota bacterium]|nr:immunoglobulin domain-containing protein [Planctomycetota bacterium]
MQRNRIASVALALAAFAGAAEAQPFNVRSWYAEGQVFVVWQFTAPPAAPTDTVEVYASVAAQVNVANMDRVGRLFYPEYTGARLTELNPAARLLLPTPAGGTYRLAPDEGAFAYTPRSSGNLFFAVVDTGSTTVNAGNSTAAAFMYDPVGDAIRPHPQFDGFTPGGFPYTAFVVWAEGRDDHTNARPDIPVLANAAKNGVPHVFAVARPIVAPPNQDLSCVFAMHGGGGEYELFLPGVPARAPISLPLTDGIVVAPDDSFYANIEGSLVRSNTSWLGYVTSVDPFDSLPRVPPLDGETVVNFTQRRVHWILDWLLSPQSPYDLDPTRVAMIGHSGGGRGTSHLTRLRPERFCAAVCYTPALNLPSGSTGDENFLRGTNDQNLASNVLGPDGDPVRVVDFFTASTRISATQRDFPFTRMYFGKRDVATAAAWNSSMRDILDDINDSRCGTMIAWDEREHGIELWTTEQPTPGPDIGQWVAPVRTVRPSAQYLVDTYRANQSYPGFFNADHDPATPLSRQPDPGNGNPNLGDPWGTWEGYFEWTGVTDTPTTWGATLYATGLSGVAIDNAPVPRIKTDVIPRKVAQFRPIEGTPVDWTVTDIASGAVVQSGVVPAESEGVVAVPGVLVPRDPTRVRLSLAIPCLDLVSPPSDTFVCTGSQLVLDVGVAGDSAGLTYQWRRNAAPVNPADNPTALTRTLVVDAATQGDSGIYTCRVANACGNFTTSPVTVVVSCCPDLNGDGNVDQDDIAYLTDVIGGGSNPTGIDPDFNTDGNTDQDDIASLTDVVAGGPCP